MRPVRRWALCVVVAMSLAGRGEAQVPFTKAQAPSYLTYCFEAATGLLPSSGCDAGVYGVMQQVVTQALEDPMAVSETLLGQLENICAADCVGQLLTIVSQVYPLSATRISFSISGSFINCCSARGVAGIAIPTIWWTMHLASVRLM